MCRNLKVVKKGGRQMDVRSLEAMLQDHYTVVPAKYVPVRAVKYDVRLRDASLGAVHAMHAIMSNMVLFECKDCKERFPAFHPAYTPPPLIAESMEVLKRGRNGVAACNMEVAVWAELPPAPGECTATEGPAQRCSGRCARCRVKRRKERTARA